MNVLESGSFFGEQGLLSEKPSAASFATSAFCELYRLRRKQFAELKLNFGETFNGFLQAAKLEAKNAKRGTKAGAMGTMGGGKKVKLGGSDESEGRGTGGGKGPKGKAGARSNAYLADAEQPSAGQQARRACCLHLAACLLLLALVSGILHLATYYLHLASYCLHLAA